MRARAGDPPRTMAQKILAARSSDPALGGDLLDVGVDQVAVVRSPSRVLAEAASIGLRRTSVEVAVAYEGRCITEEGAVDDPRATAAEFLSHGLLVARAGAGFPAAVHTERFACPARLCVTDEPRLAGVGGIGMLTLVVPPASLARALATRRVTMRSPVSLQVVLGGRLRPFVCARDVSLELLRRGLSDVVRRIEEDRSAPVVLEFTGPSARLLSIGERAVMAALAPQVGAAGALFVSDERTEVFLRDQRRSKAHRILAPDAGAPCEEVFNLDLGAVDPLALDEAGQVRAVRDLAGRPVTQALLGGDSGASLRDLLAAAALLKSKRVPARLDFLLAAPSRQTLEVLAATGALADLIATGARLIEPDARVVSGGLYGPVRGGLSLRTCDPEPRTGRASPVVVSAETLAYAVATGDVGDPRAFKRPVRVTVPRTLPTDDVLVARRRDRVESGPASRPSGKSLHTSAGVPTASPWRTAETLDLVDGASLSVMQGGGAVVNKLRAGGVAVLCGTLDEVRDLSGRAHDVAKSVRAVLAPYIPGGLVGLFSAAGIAAVRVEPGSAANLEGQATLSLPAPAQWPEKGAASVTVGSARVDLTWLARGVERSWATGGTGPDPSRVPVRPVAAAVERGSERGARGLAVMAHTAPARGVPDR